MTDTNDNYDRCSTLFNVQIFAKYCKTFLAELLLGAEDEQVGLLCNEEPCYDRIIIQVGQTVSYNSSEYTGANFVLTLGRSEVHGVVPFSYTLQAKDVSQQFIRFEIQNNPTWQGILSVVSGNQWPSKTTNA